MNFVDARVLGSGIGFGESVGLPLPERFAHLASGREVVLGVRPHDVHLDPQGLLALEVELVETLGPHVHVHGRIAAEPFVVALDASDTPKRGDRLALTVDELHLFDPTTGNAL
jgi:multiple sugar transport system ATP-binding protein